ncbi:aldehyde dehydrogenase family protein, partial [Burkholderia cenocepacia]|uniref:aldehyde dehydrogenase family protein n=1 Tax=Burkholderia cenocepacia TaxID=95486 RepID=UPI0022329D10
ISCSRISGSQRSSSDRQDGLRLTLTVFRWKDEEELFKVVNGTEFGLTASIWTSALSTAHRAASRVEAGYVWINQTSRHYLGVPFGGVKHSGLGREECLEELLDFTATKSINIQL